MLSIVSTYYKQPAALAWVLERLEEVSDQDFEFVLVDDGSGDGIPLAQVSRTSVRGTLVTLKRDRAWNIPGARNWGFALARGNTCLSTDLDHRPTSQTVEQAIAMGEIRGTAFTFQRRLENGTSISRHTDSFLIDRRDYWECGGYDERFSGSYGQNARDFGRRLHRRVNILESSLTLETNLEFGTRGRTRSQVVNKIKFMWLWPTPDRRIRRLSENVEIARF